MYDFFNLAHLITLSIFLIVAIIFFVLIVKIKQNNKQKQRIFQFMAVLNFVVHISVLWWLFITNDGNFIIPFNFIWPLALCNVITFFNLVISFMNKESKLFKFLAPACAWLGIIGGVLSLIAGKVGPVDYDSVRSLVAHFLMLLTSTYIFIAGYAKLRVSNLINIAAMLVFNGILGAITNWIFHIKNWGEANAMWFYDGLLSGVYATRGHFVAIYILVVAFITTAIYEQVKLPKAERWYIKFSKLFSKKTTKN